MAKAGGEVAAVVAGQGAAQVSLRFCGAPGAFEALAEEGLHGVQVPTAVQCRWNRQAEVRQIVDVDLRQSEAEVPPTGFECFGCRQRFSGIAGLSLERAKDEARKELEKAAKTLQRAGWPTDVNVKTGRAREEVPEPLLGAGQAARTPVIEACPLPHAWAT